MAQRYRISLNYFMLDRPLAGRKHQTYRTVGGRSASLTFDTSVVLRLVEQLQENLSEIVTTGEISRLVSSLPVASERDDIERLATRERMTLGVSIDEQLAWPSPARAFQAWRLRIERLGISIFLEKMNLEDCRGLTMFEKGELPAIVVNDREGTYPAKVFTMLHEYAHILLRKPGISDERPRNAIEKFCNHFAAALLMPRDALSRVLTVREPFGISEWNDRQIAHAAGKLKVSQMALAIRLENVKLAATGFSQRFDFGPAMPSKRKGGKPVSQAMKLVRELGSHYTNRVLSALSRREIDTKTAAQMLNSRSSHFSEIRGELALSRRLYATPVEVPS